MLGVLFADYTSKRSYMSSAILEGGHSTDIHEFFFQAAKHSDMEFVQLEGCVFAESQEWDLRLRKFQIRAVPSCKRVDLLMNRNNVFTV